MTRQFFAALLLLLAPLVLSHEEPKPLGFPDTADGRKVIAVDLHTHSVFSDGRVWPSLRVEEAERDGLAVLAITEHLEWQPHLEDIPHPDRNRAYEIALKKAEGGNVLVINGAEVTRGAEVGHMNAVFIDDANAMMSPGKPSAHNNDDMGARFMHPTADNLAEARESLQKARAQGGFIFLNHPSWPGLSPDGRGRLSDFQQSLIDDGLIDGIEVGNGGRYSADALQIALDNNLAILGTSDVHGLVAWDYAQPGEHLVPGGKGARTTTLLAVKSLSAEQVNKALNQKRTVTLVSNQLFGREQDLSTVLSGGLSFTIAGKVPSYVGESSVYTLAFSNELPIPIVIRNTSGTWFATGANTLTIPPHGTASVDAAQLSDPDQLQTLGVEVMNAHTAPQVPLQYSIARHTHPDQVEGI